MPNGATAAKSGPVDGIDDPPTPRTNGVPLTKREREVLESRTPSNSSVNCLKGFSPELLHDLNQIFRSEHRVEQTLTAVRQRNLAKEATNDHRAIEGIGRRRIEVDAYSYHYWGNRLGYDCWQDPQFLREFERDNPAARVRCGGTRIQVGWTGGDKRFSKTYS